MCNMPITSDKLKSLAMAYLVKNGGWELRINNDRNEKWEERRGK